MALEPDPPPLLLRMCEAGPSGSVRRFISRYGDTMLNIFQLRLLINEIESLPVELVTPTVKKVQEAAELMLASNEANIAPLLRRWTGRGEQFGKV